MDKILLRIDELRKSRGWSEYKLADRSGVAQSTISAWYSEKKKIYPTVNTLKKIAAAFDVSMSLLFADGNIVEVSEQQMDLLIKFDKLNEQQRDAIVRLLISFVDERV